VEWDVTIWIAHQNDSKEVKTILDKLATLPGARKLAIIVSFTSDKSNPKERAVQEYQNPNIVSFIGGFDGLHPRSEHQREQEDKALRYIFA